MDNIEVLILVLNLRVNATCSDRIATILEEKLWGNEKTGTVHANIFDHPKGISDRNKQGEPSIIGMLVPRT